jgi:hypothetical protein
MPTTTRGARRFRGAVPATALAALVAFLPPSSPVTRSGVPVVLAASAVTSNSRRSSAPRR